MEQRMDSERLVALEAQIGEIGRNMTEVKTSIAAFLTSIGNMHKEFTPREEQDKQNQLVGKQIDELEIAIGKNSEDINALRETWWSRPTWGVTMSFTLGGALIVGLVTFVITGQIHG